MNRERFEQLLDAYGADPKRWPSSERAAAEAYAQAHAAEAAVLLREARGLDAAMDAARETVKPDPARVAAILAKAPKPAAGVPQAARWALAACAVLGVTLGYGGGLMAPTAMADDEAYYLASAFDTPWTLDEGDDG